MVALCFFVVHWLSVALVSYTLHLVVTFVAGASAIVDVTAVVSGPAAVTYQ